MSEDRIQCRPVEPAEVLNPTAQDWIPHARQVIDGLVAPQMEMPAPYLLAHLLCCLAAHRWSKIDEALAPPILRPSRTKRIPQKIELLVGIVSSSVIILAVDDFRLLRMYFQAALLEAARDALQDLLRPLLRSAMCHNIICVSLERHIWMRLAHPDVERKVQENIGQKGANDSALRRSLPPWRQRTVLHLHRGFKPPLNVEQYPATLRVFPYARRTNPWSRLSKKPRMSRSMTQS